MSSIQFDLKKTTKALSLVLEKHQVQKIIPSQVHLAFDVSYSFEDAHDDGYTQQLLNRIVPFSMLFDKNHTLDSYVFSHVAEKIEDINLNNFSDYVVKQIQTSKTYNGGTNYLPIFKLLINSTNPQPVSVVTQQPTAGFFNKLFGKTETVVTTIEPEQEKHLVFFVTDGEADDQEAAARFLAQTLPETCNPYFVFISIAKKPFNFFTKNYLNTSYSSYVNFTSDQLHSLTNMSDEDLYELFITDSLINWMNK